MKHKKWWATVGATGLVAVTGVATSVPAAEASTGSCTPSVIALPLPAGTTSGDVLAAAGRYAVGFTADPGQHQRVTVWRSDGAAWSVQDLGDFGISEPFSALSATGVNSRGQVAIGVNSNVAMAGWLYSRGTVHQLADFAGGTFAYARAINERGDVVGEALDADGNDFAAIWRGGSTTPMKLAPTDGYDGSFAQGINNRGDVVGGSFSYGPDPTLAARWTERGGPVVLPTPGDAQATNINDEGRVVGYGETSTGSHAFVWDRNHAANDLGLFAGVTFSRALGVSASGVVVGFEGANPGAGIPVRHILLWPGYGPVRSLMPLSGDWADGAYSHTLDQDGDVFGASSATHTSFPQPTEWTCALAQSFVPAN